MLAFAAEKKETWKAKREKRKVCFSHVISHFEQETTLDKKGNGPVGYTKKTMLLGRGK